MKFFSNCHLQNNQEVTQMQKYKFTWKIAIWGPDVELNWQNDDERYKMLYHIFSLLTQLDFDSTLINITFPYLQPSKHCFCVWNDAYIVCKHLESFLTILFVDEH